MGRVSAIVFLLVLGTCSQSRADKVTGTPFATLVTGANGTITGARADVAVAPDGRVLVAWAEQTATNFEIWYAVIDLQGFFLTGPAQLPGVIGTPRSVRTAVTNGRFMIAWNAVDPADPLGLDHDVWFLILDHNGVPQQPTPVKANPSAGFNERDLDCAGIAHVSVR